MTIWVDADACPKAARDILCRAAIRTATELVFVANHALPLPGSPYIRSYQVAGGFDVADDEIVGRVAAGDLVVSSDIPLAAAVLARQPAAEVVNSRGEAFTAANIQSRLAMRNLMESMRSDYGQQTGGKPPYAAADAKAFADRLDRYLRHHASASNSGARQ